MKTFLQISFFFFLLIQICFAQGSWTQIGDMPEIRYGHTVNELDGKIYVVGGLNTEGGANPPRNALVYDRSSGEWDTIPLYNNEIKWAHTSCIVDGKLYVIGGNDGIRTIPTMDMFDPNTGQWESKDSMSIDRGLAASALVDGKIYVMGGMRAEGGILYLEGSQTIEAYDPLTNTWDSTLADMPTKRWGHSAVAYNGKIFVIGGKSFGALSYSSIEVYDPQLNTWETIYDSIPTPRYCLTACVLDSNIYAIGGWYSSGGGPLYDKVEVYNPESNTWYTETPMPVAIAVPASIVLDGKIQIFGGSVTTHPLTGSSGIYEFSTGDPLASGTYSIGASGYFTTIQAAFDKLSTDGVAGNVTLELIDELYTAPTDSFGFHLDGPIPGAGPNSRVTIKPAENKNVTIEGSGMSTVSFLETKYVTIDGVGITGPTTLRIHSLYETSYTWSFGVIFYHPSAHNIVQNVTIENENYTKLGAGIMFGHFVNTTASADSNLIQYNFIKKAGFGIYISGYLSSAKPKDNVIHGNKVGSESDSLISWGIQDEFSMNTIIENNIVQNINRHWDVNYYTPGINSAWSTGAIIRNNVVHNVSSSNQMGSTGILLSGDLSFNYGYNMVYNNMVYDIQSTSTQYDSRVSGIQLFNQKYPKVYYNTINLSGTGNGANPLGSAAIYIFDGVTDADIKNNILVNTRDESPYWASAIYNYASANMASDYNVFYYDDTNNNNCLVKIGYDKYYTLADWQVIGKDLHSYVEMPHFIEPYLHIDSTIATYIEARATPLTGVDRDFDGQLRNTLTPDIGADEMDGTPGVGDENVPPTEYALEQNYPNPFNPSTTFRYSIPQSSKVVIKVYDILGNEVSILMDEEKSVGTYELTWNATTLPSGVYFYHLKATPSGGQAGSFIETKKMILLK